MVGSKTVRGLLIAGVWACCERPRFSPVGGSRSGGLGREAESVHDKKEERTNSGKAARSDCKTLFDRRPDSNVRRSP
jgi:hypothetical protein